MDSSQIDYKAIGLRISKARKKLRISQMTLAELSDLTPTNISHIERGTTKLSLPSIVNIANALHLSVDELLCGSLKESKHVYKEEFLDILDDCNENEMRVLVQILETAKASIRRYLS